MRETFDQAFAAPLPTPLPFDDFLAIRLGKHGYALPLSEVACLLSRKPITRLPTSQAALLGLANIRGTVVPVYDLHLLRGAPPAEQPGWLILAGTTSVAFAFETFEGQVRVARDDILTRKDASAGEPPPASIRTRGSLRPVLHLSPLVAKIGTFMTAS